MIATQTARRTQRALGKMQQLAGQAGHLYCRRLRQAITVLDDDCWVASRFSGDKIAAVNYLQDRYFADLSGYITLQKLLRVYQGLPETAWQEYRYNIRALELLYDRPVLASGSVPVRAHLRNLGGHPNETIEEEYQRLTSALKKLDRRRKRVRRRLKELQSLRHES